MGLSSTEQRERLQLIRSDNVGPVTYRQLVTRFGSASEALQALPSITKNVGRRSIKICPPNVAENEMAQTRKAGADFCFLGTPAYPPSLAALPDAPPVLITKGNTNLLHRNQIGIVGARNASAAGMKFARTIAQDLGKADIVVTSGLARGIDTAAHQGALERSTIAVVAGGIDVIYPPENKELYADIATQGLIVCELPIGTKPVARHFPQRNRLISGLSQGVLVVEAALRSGSLITARNAGEQGREVFSVPGSPLDPRHRGTNDLLRQGATLVESADDILEVVSGTLFRSARMPELPFEAVDETPVASPLNSDDLGTARPHLLEKLSATPIDVDELIRQCNLTPALVLTILLELELAGQLERHAGNRVALI
jgi:DNA processing protein